MINLMRMAEEAAATKRKIIGQILALPDNPDIKRLDEGKTNSFIINSKDLFASDNWSPRYHDFLSQYRLIAAVIERTQIEKLPDKLKEIMTKGVVATDGGTMRLHPGVIANLKKLME